MLQFGGVTGPQARCKVCGTAITPVQAQTSGHCGGLSCMTRLTIERRARLEAERLAAWEKVAAAARDVSGLDLAVVTPHQNSPLVEPPAEQVAAFEATLRAAIEEAFGEDAPAPDMALEDDVIATPTPVSIAGCTACQGRCCAQGKAAHAFIGPRMMVRQRLRYPEMEEEEMVQFYLDQIPETISQDGCVYQGPQGCVLAREDRARICNSYQCWSLKTALRIEAENPGAQIAVAGSLYGEDVDKWIAVTAAEEPSGPITDAEGEVSMGDTDIDGTGVEAR